jgi:hypothetical protein
MRNTGFFSKERLIAERSFEQRPEGLPHSLAEMERASRELAQASK